MNMTYQAPHIGGMIIALNILMTLLVLVMTQVGMKQAGWRAIVRSKVLVGLGIFLLGLYLAILYLAQSGNLVPQPDKGPLQQTFAIVLTLQAAFYLLLLLWQPFRKVVDGISLTWLGMFSGLRFVYGSAALSMTFVSNQGVPTGTG